MRRHASGCPSGPAAPALLLFGLICLGIAVQDSAGYLYSPGPFQTNRLWTKARTFYQTPDGGVKDKRAAGARAEAGGSVPTGGHHGLGGAAEPAAGYVKFRDIPPKLVEARQHGKVHLECSALGSPAPRVSWFRNGRPLFQESSHKAQQQQQLLYSGGHQGQGGLGLLAGSAGGHQGPDVEQSLGETQSKVSIRCLSESDAGVYECVASNGKQKRSVMTEISVSSFSNPEGVVEGCQPVMGSGDELMEEVAGGAAAKPLIHESMTAYMQTIGSDAVLACRADGPHETYWYTPTEELAGIDGDKYQMTANGDLIVRGLTFDDMGVFRCVVRNTLGEDYTETFVYPMAPS